MNHDQFGDLHAWIEPEVEARLVALVLGEASDFEREELERMMVERPDLRAFKQRIEAVHGLVGDAVKPKDESQWRLSGERRANLLDKLGVAVAGEGKVVAVPGHEAARERRIRRQGLRVALMAAACLMISLLLAPFFMGGGIASKRSSAMAEKAADGVDMDENIYGEKVPSAALSALPPTVDARASEGTVTVAGTNTFRTESTAGDQLAALRESLASARMPEPAPRPEASESWFAGAVLPQESASGPVAGHVPPPPTAPDPASVPSPAAITPGVAGGSGVSTVEAAPQPERVETLTRNVEGSLGGGLVENGKTDADSEEAVGDAGAAEPFAWSDGAGDKGRERNEVQSGNERPAEIEVIREFIYPTEYATPEPAAKPQAVAKGTSESRNGGELAPAKEAELAPPPSSSMSAVIPSTEPAEPASPAGEAVLPGRQDALERSAESRKEEVPPVLGKLFSEELAEAKDAEPAAGESGADDGLALREDGRWVSEENRESGRETVFRGVAPSSGPTGTAVDVPTDGIPAPDVTKVLTKTGAAALDWKDSDVGGGGGGGGFGGQAGSGTDLELGIPLAKEKADSQLTGDDAVFGRDVVSGGVRRDLAVEDSEWNGRVGGDVGRKQNAVEGLLEGESVVEGKKAEAEKDYFGSGSGEVGDIVTGGLRSGDAAVTRNSVDAILNNPASEREAAGGAVEIDGKLATGEVDVRREFAVAPGEPLETGAVPAAVDESVAFGDQDRLTGMRAGRLVENTLEADPANEAARQNLDYLADPLRTDPAVTGEHTAKVDEVRRQLYTGEGYYNLGQYDKAQEEYEDVLRTDPYNTAARRGLERIATTKSDYYRAAYDETRAKLLAEVDEAWELSVPPAPGQEDEALKADLTDGSGAVTAVEAGKRERVEPPLRPMEAKPSVDLTGLVERLDAPEMAQEVADTTNKLRNIIIPVVDFDQATVEEALDFLRQRSKELDVTELDAGQRGIGFELRKPRVENGAADDALDADVALGGTDPGAAQIKELKLRNVPMSVVLQYIGDQAGLRYEIGPEGNVVMVPISAGEAEDPVSRVWRVAPEVISALEQDAEYSQTDDPFADQNPADNAGERGLHSLEDILKNKGVSFPEGSGVSYLPESQTLVVKNTPSNIDLVDVVIANAAEEIVVQRQAEKQKEKSASQEPFSTFSLNVSDVSFKLAQVALAKGEWPEAERIRVEEFVNAFDYGDPTPSTEEKVSCQVEQAAHPFLQQRNVLRIAMRTAAVGRADGTPLRLTVLLDNSGSMDRADRAEAVQNAFSLLAGQLNPQDEVTLIGFARTPRLLRDGVSGDKAGELLEVIAQTPSEGGTNLEEALKLGMEKALEHKLEGAQNRIILLTDGAANLGDAKPERLAGLVETMRQRGIAFDACGVGADGLNDDILEALTRKGDGRYYFLDRPEDADAGFARQIAGALRPAAKNVKVQVEFNPKRVGRYALYGFEKHELQKEDFRNDSVDAAELAAEEAGVAMYHFEALPDGEGDVGTVSVRFQDMATGEMVEKLWAIPYEPQAAPLEEAVPALRLATSAAMLGESLKGTAVGGMVDLGTLSEVTRGLQSIYPGNARIGQLVEMIEQARGMGGER